MARVIKKHPTVKPSSHKYINSTLYLKSKTPYISALKRVSKFLTRLSKDGSKYVTILGMGKAVEKALSLACHFQDQSHKRVEILTKSVDVIDELSHENESDDDEDPSDVDVKLQKRSISGVEIRIFP